MIITYLYHSGFVVELKNHILLFDYYTGEESNNTKQSWKLPVWNREKQIYVFVSHKHRDHFDMSVFALAEQYKNIHFFLGSDVKLSEKYLERNGVCATIKEKITNIGKNRELKYQDICIETLRSTDAGVAFLVDVEGKKIYHAGDLNWWHWEDEALEYNENMKQAYCHEINKIAGWHFDVAFVPLDPRLSEAYCYGMDYFLDKVIVSTVFPMHMWEQYDWIKKYNEHSQKQIMEISHTFEQFEIL